jgi:hypothetical protein
MTERIEAIAAKCRAENWERADLDYVQFAEAIVKECISVMDNECWGDGHEIYQAMELIKFHFGVGQ